MNSPSQRQLLRALPSKLPFSLFILYLFVSMTLPPLPPANPDEHQYWTDPILCEETRTRLEHFRNLGMASP